METGNLGMKYGDGEIIIRQGDDGECMYVVQSGTVDILEEIDGREIHISTRGEGEFFGEMSLFERAPRMSGRMARRGSSRSTRKTSSGGSRKILHWRSGSWKRCRTVCVN
jgi:hypothetical protein